MRLAQRRTCLTVLACCALFSYRAATQDGTSASFRHNTTRQELSKIVSVPKSALDMLDRHGVTFQETFIYDWSKSLRPGTDHLEGYGRHLVDFAMPVDGEKLYGLKGSSGQLRLRNHANNFGAADVALAQVLSNIDGCSRTTLYEAWLQQKLFSGKLRIKGGKIDANTEFAAVSRAGDFLNSSMGYSPTIVEFPTYPEPKLGLNAFLQPTSSSSLGLGLYATSEGGHLSIVEPSQSWALGNQELPGHVNFGYWHIGAERIKRFDGSTADSTQGLYTVMEQVLWKGSGSDQARTLSSFFQFGSSRGEESVFTRHVGGGLVLQSPRKMRRDNSIGVAVSWVRFSSEASEIAPLSDELVFETYYKIALQKHLAFVSDFQYVHHPAGLALQRDLPVITPRLVISF